MKLEVISVVEPVWLNPEKTRIHCLVEFDAYAEKIPIVASADYDLEHGREIYQRCIKGEFGPIAAYSVKHVDAQQSDVPPSVEQADQVAAWPEVHDFLNEANLENSYGSSRGIGLVWGCMLEVMLEQFLLSELSSQKRGKSSLKRDTKHKARWDFEGKIEGALFEGMIEKTLAEHLHAIRKIRNACAHEWRFNFENPLVKNLSDDFNMLKEAYFPTFRKVELHPMMKMVFSAACSTIIADLASRTDRAED